MSTTLAITAVLLWIAVAFEAENPGIVRRVLCLPILFLVALSIKLFELASGWSVSIELVDPSSSDEPTLIFTEEWHL